MKFLKLADEVLFNTELSSNEKIVYAVLLRLYNQEKQCAYPSMEYISEKTGMSVSTINRSIKKLVKLEFITITKKKSVLGNFNTYTNLKHLIGTKEENKVPTKKEPKIVSDCKEKGIQLEIPKVDEEVQELSEYTKEHQAKISLVLKYVKSLTEKQQSIIAEMELETLRQAIRLFKKKRGRVFTFLMNLYLDIASKNNIELSTDIKKYSKYIELTPEEVETQRALQELELYGVPVY